MIKTGIRDSIKDLLSRGKRQTKILTSTSSDVSQCELESPKAISLEDLRALIPEAESDRSLSPPPTISIEKLHELIPPHQSLESLQEVDLSDLIELLEPAGAISRETVELKTKDLLAPGGEESSKFRVWKIVDDTTTTTTSKLSKTRLTRSLDESGKTKENHNKLKKARSVESVRPIKVKVVPKRRHGEKVIGPEGLVHKLQELSQGDNLDKWIAELKLPNEFNLDQIREQIRSFIKEKSWERHENKLNFGIMDGSLSKKLWTWFKDLSIAKQIIVVVGLTLVFTAVGFLTAQLLSLLWPSLLGAATSGESALIEIGIQGFINRQEAAFQLLYFHAEHAKPLSYNWANQYILWKYCR